jgi:hypothetical protein
VHTPSLTVKSIEGPNFASWCPAGLPFISTPLPLCGGGTGCWLRQCPELGILGANQRQISRHHADDTKVFLSSLQPELVQGWSCAWIRLTLRLGSASTLPCLARALGFWRHGSINHLVARGAKWATKLVDGLCPPVPHHPCEPRPAPSIHLPEPEELPGGVRPLTDRPVRSDVQARLAAAGPPSPVPSWVGMARVVLLRVCPSLHPMQTLLCAAFCAFEAVFSGLLPILRDQHKLVPVGALRHMLLAIACLGHVQQHPESDLPQLREGF